MLSGRKSPDDIKDLRALSADLTAILQKVL